MLRAPAHLRQRDMVNSMTTIVVIGAGTMGNGIAHTAAASGFNTILVDVSDALLDRAMATISTNLQRAVDKGKLSAEEKQKVLGRIKPTTHNEAITDADLVVEAIVESVDAKTQLFEKLDKITKPDCILASNTSSISITKIAASTKRPEKVIGMHFMNPVPVMTLVEVIRGIATDEATFAATRDLAVKLGKTPVAAEDFPAFIVNRILLPMVNEAVYTLYEGVGSVEAIDTAMKLGANHPMGPLELADFIGLDTCLSVMQVLYEGLADSKYRPCPLLVKYVEAGWLGRKANRGFYDYSGERPVPTR